MKIARGPLTNDEAAGTRETVPSYGSARSAREKSGLFARISGFDALRRIFSVDHISRATKAFDPRDRWIIPHVVERPTGDSKQDEIL
jgi:hypothetical protein